MKKTQKKVARVSTFIPTMGAVGAFVVLFFSILVSVSYSVSMMREREHASELEVRVQALEARVAANDASNSAAR